jgi:Domain of unknown function (DUF6378)
MTDHLDIIKTSATVIAKRRESYGPPTECFERAATVASIMLGKPVTPYEVVSILHAVKLARIPQSPKNLDHYVDGVSYLAFAGEFSGAGKEDARRDTKAFAPTPAEIRGNSLRAIEEAAASTVASTVGGRPVVPLRGDPKPNGPGA